MEDGCPDAIHDAMGKLADGILIVERSHYVGFINIKMVSDLSNLVIRGIHHIDPASVFERIYFP